MGDRKQIASQAAQALETLAAKGSLLPALIGFDGFIDAITEVVDKRHAMTTDAYTRLKSIDQFALRVAAAAGKSTNIELVVTEERFGGNGPLLAGALGQLGMPVTYVGAVGQAAEPRKLHPIYTEFAKRCRQVIPVCAPAHTDALEFEDGKVMLSRPANVQTITWDMLVRTLTLPVIQQSISEATLIGIVNWVMMGGVESIWEGLCRDVFPNLTNPASKRVFIDLADPAKRTDEDVLRALHLLKKINATIPVTLGLNLAEAERIAAVINVPVLHEEGMHILGHAVQNAAAAIRKTLGLACVVIHPREGAAAADANTSAWFDGPFTNTPKLSTGAGDHFNGGFALAQVHGLPLEQCLAIGCGVSGAYVRDAVSPNLPRLCEFLRALPLPEHA